MQNGGRYVGLSLLISSCFIESAKYLAGFVKLTNQSLYKVLHYGH